MSCCAGTRHHNTVRGVTFPSHAWGIRPITLHWISGQSEHTSLFRMMNFVKKRHVLERRQIHPLGSCDGCHRTTAPVRSPHTRYRWRGERVTEPIKCMGIIRRPWLTRASGGNLARTPGLHPYSFTRSAMGFLMTTESQDLGLTSHPKDGMYMCGCVCVHTHSI